MVAAEAGWVSETDETVWQVSELTREIRGLLEGHFGSVWVEGEISNLRRQASGHQYFTLKDEVSQLSCVMFRGVAQRATFQIRDGDAVRLYGELSVYEPRGTYQLVVKQVKPRGQGSLQARFEALKRRLFEEGLFDEACKQPIPAFPAVVALVTSPTGAAVRDMLQILERRSPWVRVLVYPVRVQGAGAEEEIARAIERLNDWETLGIPRPDTLVVGRGGGSLEDLWNFNEERVARAIFASEIPVISAVGHEIDFSIADFVADLRAPTPSAAAELLAPNRADMLSRLEALSGAMRQRASARLSHAEQRLQLMARGSLHHEPRRCLLEWEQRLDEAEAGLRDGLRQGMDALKMTCAEQAERLGRLHPARLLESAEQRLNLRNQALLQALRQQPRQGEEAVRRAEDRLRALGPDSVLSRGFSYTRTEAGRLLRSAAEAPPGTRLVTRLADGTLASVVE